MSGKWAFKAAVAVWAVVFLGRSSMETTPLAPRPQDQAASSVRGIDRAAKDLLADGLRRSATLRSLSADIGASDVIAYVAGSSEPGSWRGSTRFLSATVGRRMLGVKVNIALDVPERLGVLGHELQHVCEVAKAPAVTDTEGMRRLFVALGDSLSPAGDRFETATAQAIERKVRTEVTRGR